MPETTPYRVMLSGTYVELKEHRRAVSDAMIGQDLLPIAMDFDSALPEKDLIDASLAKVDAADAYVGLISYRYGQMPKSDERNPNKLSLTELEFLRAVEREIPICMFIMHPKHEVPSEEVNKEHGKKRKLRSFIKLAKTGRISAEFESVADLKAKAVQSLVKLREVLDQRVAAKPTEPPTPVRVGSPQPSHETLVTPPLRCIGRDDDVTPLVDILIRDGDRIAVLVLGGPGMGKTTITREVASRPEVIAKFGHRRWFVELDTAPNAETLQQAIIVALGLDPASVRFDAALAKLGEAPGLLVLDNLETPWDGERQKVETVLTSLHRVPQLAVLASIRGNEPPAGVRWARQRTMHPLEAPHDAEMFLDIASDIKADDPELSPLLTLLGGVPIAIELVAQQAAPHDTLAAVHAEWQRVGSALAKRRGVERSRLSSLEVSLELSFQSPRLTEAGRRLFCILGQLPAGMAPDDMKALLGDAAFEARQGLLSTALAIEREDRLDLLPPMRDHAQRLHMPNEQDAELWQEHYLVLAREEGRRIGYSEGAKAVNRLIPELPNLDAAQRAALLRSQLDKAVSPVESIAALMRMTGLGVPTTIRELAAACGTTGNREGEGRCYSSLGDIALERSDYAAARTFHERALPIHREIGSTHYEANCFFSLGEIALLQSDPIAARSNYEQAHSRYRQIGNVHGEANCINALGYVALKNLEYDAAQAAFDRALILFRRIGNILGEANSVMSIGDIAYARSDRVAARASYQEALVLYQRVADPFSIGNAHRALALVTDGEEHAAHRAAAKEAWLSSGRKDLVIACGLSDA